MPFDLKLAEKIDMRINNAI